MIIISNMKTNLINIEIGNRIQLSRKQAKYTQMVFAELIGVSTQYISDLERGIVGTSIPTLIKICDVLNVSADYILRGTDPQIYKSPQTLISKINELTPAQKKIVENGIDVLIEAFHQRSL